MVGVACARGHGLELWYMGFPMFVLSHMLRLIERCGAYPVAMDDALSE